MFDLDRFVADCQAALASGGGSAVVRDVMAKTVSHPASVLAGLGEPQRAGITVLFRSDTLTVLNLVWGPHMTIMPHNHNMWAVIGLYTGREDNIFWRKLPPDARWPIEAAGARSLMPGDACPLGRDIIHSVNNPVSRLTGALHVYGGDFLDHPRREWDCDTLREQDYDLAKARQLFEDSNRMLRQRQ